MTEDDKHSEEISEQAAGSQDEETVTTTPAENKPEQGEDAVSMKDYKELQSFSTQSAQKVKDLESKLNNMEQFKNNMEQAFNPSGSVSRGTEPTVAELRAQAETLRAQGYDIDANSLEFQAKQIERNKSFDLAQQQSQEMNEIYAEISKPESAINPEDVDFQEIGKISKEMSLSPKQAYNEWIVQNYSRLSDARVKREAETLIRGGDARGLTGGEYIPTEKEDKELNEYRDLIGDPSRQFRES